MQEDIEMIRFAVSDTGEGMSEEGLSKVFREYEQAERSTSAKHGGTGLGLSIVKHIMNRHEGTLKIKSSISEGSQFSCVFPKSSLAMKSAKSSSNI